MVILITALILLTFCNQSFADASQAEIIFTPSSDSSAHEYEEILKVIDCFQVYANFFNDTYSLDEYIISRHGENLDEGMMYLRESFNEELAFNILDHYTYWNEEIKKQVIITREGIPVFTIDDLNECSFYIEDETISLKVNYYNCYTLGDHYVYYITAYKVKDQYIINDLRWQAKTLFAKL